MKASVPQTQEKWISISHRLKQEVIRMDMERIISVLISLIESQEGVKIEYTLEKKEEKDTG